MMADSRPSCEEAVLLIQFDNTRVQSFINSMVAHKAIIKNYDGCCLGYATKTIEVEGQWNHPRAIGILTFSSIEQAERWFDSDSNVHQPDYMDGADIIIAPAKGITRTSCWTEIMDLELTSPDYFNDHVAGELVEMVESVGAQPVGTTRCEVRRGLWFPNLLIINQYPNEKMYSDMYCGENYTKLKDERLKSSRGRIIGFNLCPVNEEGVKPCYCVRENFQRTSLF